MFTTMLDLIATQSQLVQDSTGPHCFPTQKYVVSLQRRGSTPWHDRNSSAGRRRIVGGRTKARCSSHLENMSNRCFPSVQFTASLQTIKLDLAWRMSLG